MAFLVSCFWFQRGGDGLPEEKFSADSESWVVRLDGEMPKPETRNPERETFLNYSGAISNVVLSIRRVVPIFTASAQSTWPSRISRSCIVSALTSAM